VVIRASSAGRRGVALEIIDRGIGIPAVELPEVTRRFVRGSNSGSGGSGLGLAIVSRIVSDHQGTLEIRSELGVGTTVRIVLPEDGAS
jgi:two-component system phosphate regulon sensor histidine kinase PhoR